MTEALTRIIDYAKTEMRLMPFTSKRVVFEH